MAALTLNRKLNLVRILTRDVCDFSLTKKFTSRVQYLEQIDSRAER